MGKTHRSAQRKISSSEKKLLEEIKSLKKLPESENKAHDIEEKSQQLFILRGSARVVLDGYEVIYYESFEGKFEDGSKAVMVYKKEEGDIYWQDVALVTWMTDLQAQDFFGVNNLTDDEYGSDGIHATGCGMEDYSGWYENDEGNFLGHYDFDGAPSQFMKDLGLSGAKGYIMEEDGSINSYQEKAEDILRGQEIIIFYSEDGEADRKLKSVSFPQSNISTNETPAWAWVAVVLCVLLFIALLLKK